MSNTSVRLGEHFTSFVHERVSEGRYGSASEVIREGLRLLEEREARLAALQKALQEGLDSGVAGPLDIDEIIREAKAERDDDVRRAAD